ncbi:hypothetical protein [Bilifractor porci]|uniref:Uncharacterized protein n=1 Tax=Bilifractor porci TaxID=2606636 RepID=A0A7X2P6L0_9FIRM|nr:hypothetical protein [Bilifractor porci]MST81154.1 hypothetical protein [Bilifractor porci]
MEYVQMTLTDWLEMKKKLEADLTGVTASFIRIGYTLRRIEDERLYERDGYSSVAEFARKEYGLSASTVSRFMAINKRYSIGGYSEKLAPEYAGLGSSKLSEMLALPDSDLSMITPETPRDTIRELKDFNKQEQEGSSDLDVFLLEFFSCCVGDWKSAEPTEKSLKEALNPSGSRVYRKGKYFMAFYDADIKIKRFGAEPTSLSWGNLAEWVQEHTEELIGMIRKEKDAGSTEQGQEEEEEEVAPAQKSGKSAERLNKTPDPEEKEQGQEEEKPKDPETAEKEEIAPAQKVEKPAEILDTKPDLAENMNPPEENEAAEAEEPEKTAETLDKEPVSGEVVDREDELENLIGRLKEHVENRHWNLALFTAEKIVKRLGEKV